MHQTRAFVLLPLAIGLGGLAAIVGLCRFVTLSRASSVNAQLTPSRQRAAKAMDVLVIALAWLALVFAIASLACAFAGFGRLRSALDADRDARTYYRRSDAATGYFGLGMWIWLVADISLFFGAACAVLTAWKGGQEGREAGRNKVWGQK
jgi:hypothetical protein